MIRQQQPRNNPKHGAGPRRRCGLPRRVSVGGHAAAVAPSPGEHAYLALVRSGVAWRDVPRLSGFLWLWGCIQPPARRRALLASHRVFAAQLAERGEGETCAAVVADDARAFIAWGLPCAVLDDRASYALHLIEAGAPRCLRAYFAMRATALSATTLVNLLDFAIRCAQPDCVRELLARGAPWWSRTALNVATYNGDLRTLRLAMDGGAPMAVAPINLLALAEGHQQQGVMQVLPFGGNAFTVATIVGSLPCLRMLFERGSEAGAKVALNDCWHYYGRTAAEHGHLACLRYLHRRISLVGDWPRTNNRVNTIWPAVRGGFLDCIHYVLEHRIYGDAEDLKSACRIAASYCQLAALVCLRERGCFWDERTCSAAADANSLECLRYAHENGCPWTANTITAAAAADALECMRYAIDHGCPFDARAANALAKSRSRAYLLARTRGETTTTFH